MAQMVEPDGFTLVWGAKSDCISEIRVARRDDGEPAGTFPSWQEGEQCVAVVYGIDAGVRYSYEIIDRTSEGDGVWARGTVRTAAARGESFRFLAFGDSGMGLWGQRRLAGRMLELEPDLIVHTGDLVYQTGAPEQYPAKFYGPYQSLIADSPFYPCLGNHDVRTDDGAPLLEAFILPENGPAELTPERNYWFDYGDVRFVAIDSNLDRESLGDVVAPWLDEVLTGAGDRWKIVFFHHPVFTASWHPPSEKMLETVVPVLDRHRVDLVLAGHNHLYERTHPVFDGVRAPDGDGTVYITTGAGGASLYRASRDPPDYLACRNDFRLSFTVVDVTPGALMLRQVDVKGKSLDEFELTRRGKSRPVVDRPHAP